jgi:protein-S-isoprenylcysteine O-methyltransferase Ste14
LGRAVSAGAPLCFPGDSLIPLVARAGLAVLALTVGGCALTFDATELGVPATLAESAQTPPQGTPFKVSRHPVYVLWGLTAVSRPNVEDLLAGQAGTGARIANLKIKVGTRVSDLLVTVLTLGVFAPRTVTLEGIVVPP